MINWRIFRVLLLAGIFGALAVFPFVLETQADMLAELPFSTPVLILLSMLQTTVMLAIAIFVGLLAADRVGLDMPLISLISQRKLTKPDVSAALKANAPIGLAVGVAIILGDLLGGLFIPPIANPPVELWRGALASFYGGIVEEILIRLFLMSALVWVFGALNSGKRTPAIYWLAIIVSAILFGLGHLPATAALVEITPLIILRAIVLNGIGGIVFGWLYWKRGLGAAMIAHFFADIVILVALPVFISIV